MSKEIVEYKENFISKMLKRVKTLFGKKEIVQENIENNEESNSAKTNIFKENLEVKLNEENLKVLKLQKDYKAGIISEEDLTDEEHQKLIELYEKQNKELREKIELRRQKIR